MRPDFRTHAICQIITKAGQHGGKIDGKEMVVYAESETHSSRRRASDDGDLRRIPDLKISALQRPIRRDR